jgi:hypothetical protein
MGSDGGVGIHIVVAHKAEHLEDAAMLLCVYLALV